MSKAWVLKFPHGKYFNINPIQNIGNNIWAYN